MFLKRPHEPVILNRNMQNILGEAWNFLSFASDQERKMQEMPTVGEEKSLEQNKNDLREFVGFYPSIARRMGKRYWI